MPLSKLVRQPIVKDRNGLLIVLGSPIIFINAGSDFVAYVVLPFFLLNCEPVDLSHFVVNLRTRHLCC